MALPSNKRVILVRNPAFFDFGGGERFPVHLALELKKHGYSPTVVSRSRQVLNYAAHQHIAHTQGWWWTQQNWSGRCALLFPIYLCWQLLLCAWYVQLLLRLRSDVVHLQSKDDFIAGTFAARLLGKRVIWTDHADLKYIFANHALWYKNPVGKLVYFASKFAHKITLVSESERELIAATLGHPTSSKFVVIHNGVKDEHIEPAERLANRTIFCATSRLVTAKGIGELIAAFQKLHAEQPDTLLWLVGDGPERSKFEKQASGDASIVFIGHSNEPLRYVATSDVFVHPSYHEGFSLSLVEAAMLGRPIITCNVGGNPEIIQDQQNGLLIPPRDSSALYEAMHSLLTSEPDRKRLGDAARQTYQKGFDFAKIVTEEFIPIYEQ